jgi:hypothetical protein
MEHAPRRTKIGIPGGDAAFYLTKLKNAAALQELAKKHKSPAT